MKAHSKDLKELALLISVLGFGLSSAAAAQTVADAPAARTNDEPQRSDWDWVPPDVMAASQAEENRLMAAAEAPPPEPGPVPVPVPVAEAAMPESPGPGPEIEPVAALSKSDWDWSPADAPGVVTARVPVPHRPAAFETPAEPLYRDARYTVATLQRAAASNEAKPPLEAPGVQAAPPVAAEPASASLPSIDAPPAARFVVASHGDKVLMSLLSVKSGAESEWGRLLQSPDEVAVLPRAVQGDERPVLPAVEAIAPVFDRIDVAHADAVKVEPPIGVLGQARPFEAPARIVVATHADKVLLSLTSVRAVDATPMELMALLPQDIAVSKVAEAPAPAARSSIAGKGWVAVDSHQLEQVRGGFSTPQLQVSFGISRAVYINGSLVTTTSLNLSDAGKLTAGAGAAVNLPASLGLIQSGSGNSFLSMPTANGSVATVIQNTLNNQKIQSLTQINATVNSMQILRGMNLQQSLRGAVIDSLRH